MAKIKAGFKAGDMVNIIMEDGGYADDGLDYVMASYHYTAKDTERWYADQAIAVETAQAAGEDTFHIVMDSAGESRLPPRGGRTRLYPDVPYRVLRARCRESFSYYNATGGWTKLLDLNTGREVFIKMNKLQKVVA